MRCAPSPGRAGGPAGRVGVSAGESAGRACPAFPAPAALLDLLFFCIFFSLFYFCEAQPGEGAAGPGPGERLAAQAVFSNGAAGTRARPGEPPPRLGPVLREGLAARSLCSPSCVALSAILVF